jgi:hypothetical protein
MQVITAGVTTCEDVSWWMWEAGRALGFPLSFKPSFGVQREGTEGTLSGDTGVSLFSRTLMRPHITPSHHDKAILYGPCGTAHTVL